MTDIIKQMRKSLLEKMKKIICLLTHKRKFLPQIKPLWLKYKNQCINMGGLLWRGYMTRAYMWSKKCQGEAR